MITIQDGDVVATKNLRVILQEGAGWADFKTPRGQAFVVVLLGVAPIDNWSEFALSQLKKLGWEGKWDAGYLA